ncbi:MAG: PQQ-binding-like beta-propeller repeat protein [Thermoplasmatota archaeon]
MPPKSGLDSAWPFAQGSLDGRRASIDSAITSTALSTLGASWIAETVGAVTGTPTVDQGRVYVGTWKGMVYALDAKTGAKQWMADVGAQVDGSVTLAGGLALVGDAHGVLHALDATSGKPVWSVTTDTTTSTHLYATPLALPTHGTRPAIVVQAIGSDQESARLHGDQPVDFRGKVAAFDLATGKERWRTYLVPEGMTGAPVWGTPVYDAATDRIVFGTGNAYTAPAGDLTDSIVALQAEDGGIAWHYQASEADVFTQKHPDSPDHDFGATPNLFDSGERRLVGVGQKSSIFWAVDVANGQLAWSSGASQGGEGVIGDAAVSGDVVVVPYVTLGKVSAFSTADGKERWSRPLSASGFSDVVAVPGAVIAADAAGDVHGFAAATGAVLWNASIGEGGVFGGLSVAAGHLFVPVVRDGFIGDKGAVVAFGPGGTVATRPAGDSAATVLMQGFAFVPVELHVAAGTTVTWVNKDPEMHTVTAVDGSFDLTVAPGAQVQHRFDAAGTYEYYCRPHSSEAPDGTRQGMKASVVVA